MVCYFVKYWHGFRHAVLFKPVTLKVKCAISVPLMDQMESQSVWFSHNIIGLTCVVGLFVCPNSVEIIIFAILFSSSSEAEMTNHRTFNG